MKEKEYSTAKRDIICAVVVTFNRRILLGECLTALLRQSRPLEEIIVIDNASTDGTEELMKTKFAGITYVKLCENIGGAGGFHEGMKLAYEKGYDWIWVMDDDASPMADALQRLLDCPVRLEDKLYALASAVLNRDETISLEHRRLFNAKTRTETIIGADKYTQDYFQMDTGSFVGLLLSRKAIEEVGLPLKEMFIYYDDTEYSLRIRTKGTMFTVPGSKIVHGKHIEALDESKLIKQAWDWRIYYFRRNQIYTYRKHGRIGLRFYAWILIGLLGIFGEILSSHRSKFRSTKILCCSTFDGLRGKLGKNSNFLPG